MITTNVITLNVAGALELILKPPEPQPTGKVIVTVKYGSFIARAEGSHMAYTLPVDHYIEVEVSYEDAFGNVAEVDGAVSWGTSNDQILTIAVDPDNSMKCTITPTGKAGSAQVTATADADMGTGVTSLITLLDVTTVAGAAVAGVIQVVGSPIPVNSPTPTATDPGSAPPPQ
jgi:hypothetical protein